ncbi:MAG: hypothetical protein GY913_28490 [Proteobacteria bacterium]|nr:hypothetical protein [Pseudomonadota bacterium]
MLAILVLALNDQLLKDACPGFVTGKLSDVAGMAFFPLLLQAGLEVVQDRLGDWTPSRRVLVIASIATGLYFGGIQVLDPLADSYRYGLAALQWPFRALLAGSWVDLAPVHLVQDPTDLLTLPALGLAVWAGWKRTSTKREP